MGKNLVRDTITIDGTWVAPAGVTSVRVLSYASMIRQCAGNNSGSTAAITPTGKLYSWGINSHGELGLGNITPASVPLPVLEGKVWRMIALGSGFMIGLEDTTGSLYGWGFNNNGQLANGTLTSFSSPIVCAAAFNFRQVAAGTQHVMAVSSVGNAYGAGLNTSGQIGIGSVATPVEQFSTQVVGGITWQQVAAGGAFSAGIDTSGNAYAWGSNAEGQLGIGTVTDHSSPVAVVGGLKFKKIVCGGQQAFGITTSGDLYAWGSNTNGQLGTGNTTTVSSPVLVIGGFKWADVQTSEGGFNTTPSTIGLTTDGNVYCWGANTNGQLGDGTVVAKSSPVLIQGSFKYTQIMSGGTYNGAISNNGLMYMWGLNTSGNLGGGTVTPASSPALVTSFLGSIGVGFSTWQAAQARLLNEQILPVTPGTSYPVTILADAISLGAQSLAQGLGVTFIVIEYFA